MSRTARKRRKRKVREKEVKKRKEELKVVKTYNKKYPKLIVEDKYADIELVQFLKSFARDYDFRKCRSGLRMIMSDFHRLPHKELISAYNQDLMDIGKELHGDFLDEGYVEEVSKSLKSNQIYGFIESVILHLLWAKLEEAGLWSKYMPNHYINVQCYYGDIMIFVDSFRAHYSSFGCGYYSSHNPLKIEIKGQEYTVALSSHAIDRMCERIGTVDPALQPLHTHYTIDAAKTKYVQLTDGSDAICFEHYFTGKHQDHLMSFAHALAYKLYGYVPDEFYYLCGYSPIGYCKDNFIHLKTFLEPGMNDTPESILFKICLKNEKIRFKDILRKDHIDNEYMELRDFFHTNGCDQIREV